MSSSPFGAIHWLGQCVSALMHPGLLAWQAAHLLLLIFLTVSLGRGLAWLLFSLQRTVRRLHGQKRSPSLPEKLLSAAARAAVPSECLVVLAQPSPEIYCLGLWQPKIVVSLGVIDLLSPEELLAALRHENYHRTHRHGLKLLAAETLREIFWFWPLGKELAAYLRYRSEAAADAAAAGEGSAPLRCALAKLLSHPQPAWQVGLTTSPAAARVETIIRGQVLPFRPRFRCLANSAAASVLLLLLLLCPTALPVQAFLPAPLDNSATCEQPPFSPLTNGGASYYTL